MYEDASWYSSFVPRAVKPLDKPKHRRRESRLEQQPSVSPPPCFRVRVLMLGPQEASADVERVEAIVEAAEDNVEPLHGPPPATVARRAKSYSDFYDIVRAHLRKEHGLERKTSRQNLHNELEFADW